MPERSRGAAVTAPAPVLIIEPNAAIAQLLTLVLDEEGYGAESVTAPHEALAVLAARGPDAFAVMLSAPCAPPGAPYAWLACLRASTRAAIVICTRHPAALYADHRARGFAAVIEEPCELQDVLDVVACLHARATVEAAPEAPYESR